MKSHHTTHQKSGKKGVSLTFTVASISHAVRILTTDFYNADVYAPSPNFFPCISCGVLIGVVYSKSVNTIAKKYSFTSLTIVGECTIRVVEIIRCEGFYFRQTLDRVAQLHQHTTNPITFYVHCVSFFLFPALFQTMISKYHERFTSRFLPKNCIHDEYIRLRTPTTVGAPIFQYMASFHFAF